MVHMNIVWNGHGNPGILFWMLTPLTHRYTSTSPIKDHGCVGGNAANVRASVLIYNILSYFTIAFRLFAIYCKWRGVLASLCHYPRRVIYNLQPLSDFHHACAAILYWLYLPPGMNINEIDWISPPLLYILYASIAFPYVHKIWQNNMENPTLYLQVSIPSITFLLIHTRLACSHNANVGFSHIFLL